MYPVEHFYYGQLVHHGKPTGEMRVLAKSSGVTETQVADAVRSALLPPLVDAPDASWGVMRGKKVPFFMVQSQRGSAGQTTLHVMLLPGDALRALQGNIKALLGLIKPQLPIYDRLGEQLVPITLPDASPRDASEQVDDMLDLMTFTRNRTNTIEMLLSAVVEGVQLVVQNAPPNLQKRTGFIQGLLTLLPSSTRFGVSFSTYNERSTPFETQITFMEGDVSENIVAYDWESAMVSGPRVSDSYSHYIVGQLRLDAELALNQAEALTPVAGWRMRSGDRLAGALAYASNRVKLDNALTSNQPVEIEEVSRVLKEDPTLSSELRATYAEHLVKFALAMDKMEHADPVALVLRNDPQLNNTIHQYFANALQEGDSDLVYETLLRWMSDPLGPEGKNWVDLLHSAMMVYITEVAEDHDTDSAHDFLDRMQTAGFSVALDRIAGKIIGKLLPLVADDRELGRRLLMLGFSYLSADDLRKLLGVGTLESHVPPPVELVLARFKNGGSAPAGALVSAANALDDEQSGRVLLRLVQMAAENDRLNLIDAATLEKVAQSAATPDGSAYSRTLVKLVQDLHGTALKSLEEPAPRYLLQILLAVGEYPLLARYMIEQSRDLYAGDRQDGYIRMLQKLFGDIRLKPQDAQRANSALSQAGIKGIPMMMASVGLLGASGWSEEMSGIASEVGDELLGNPAYLELVPPSALIGLLHFYGQNEDLDHASQIAGLIPSAAAQHNSAGLKMIQQMYRELQWSDEAKSLARAMVHQYVREASDENAKQAVHQFGKALGREMGHRLEITLRISRFAGGLKDLTVYARHVHLATHLLQDTADSYADRNQAPTQAELRDVKNTLNSDLSESERKQLVEGLHNIGRAIARLADQQRTQGAKKQDGLLTGQENPGSALDVFRVMAGPFAKGRQYDTKIEAHGKGNPFLMRSGQDIYRDVLATADILRNATRAFPPDRPLRLTASDVRAEMDTLWKTLTQEEQQSLQRMLAIEFQRLPDLVLHIAKQGDGRIFEKDNAAGNKVAQGKQAPRNTLELFRFGMAYFK